MWIVYDTCKLEDLESKAGNKYTAYALRGTKKGYKGEPDAPYIKPLFENSMVTVIEKGVARPNQSIVGFIHAMCNPGDTLELRFDRSGGMPELATIENKSNFKPEYKPLTDEQVADMQAAQAMANAPAPAPVQQTTMNQMPPQANGAPQYIPQAQA